MTQTDYQPGVCNIGREEIARRRNFGWAGLGLTIVALVAMVWADVDPIWRLLLFIPAAGAASGFLQAHFHFCSGFSRAGVFNFGRLGETHRVEDEEARAADRRKGNRISLYAALIGAAVAGASLLIG